MNQTGDIDVDKVEKELLSALEADRKYSRENDAKFRAVRQKVATYEEFRDIVNASHLSPLDHGDITGRKGRKQPWNPTASSTVVGGVAVTHHHANIPSKIESTQDFLREWRKLKTSPQAQYQFLLQLGIDQFHAVFKVEVSMGLLGEIIKTLNLYFAAEDKDKIVAILGALGGSSRFNLSLSFLDQAEKTAVKELFEKLKKEVFETADLNTLEHYFMQTTA